MKIRAHEALVGDAVTVNGIYQGKIVEIRHLRRPVPQLDKYSHRTGRDADDDGYTSRGVAVRKAVREEQEVYATGLPDMLLVISRYPSHTVCVAWDAVIEVFRPSRLAA